MGELGKACKRLRLFLGASVQDVAEATGFSVSSVYLFEQGHGSNIKILMWYVNHGLNIAEVMKEGE